MPFHVCCRSSDELSDMSECIKSHLKRIGFYVANLKNDKFLAALEALNVALCESDYDNINNNDPEDEQSEAEDLEEDGEEEEEEVRIIT